MNKAKLAILLNIQSSRNPVLLFCLKNLSDDHKITVISVDEFQDAAKFPNVEFVNYSRSFRFLSRALYHLIYNAAIISVLLGVIPARERQNSALMYNSIIGFYLIQMIFLPSLYAQYLLRKFNCSTIICIDAGAMTAARIVKFFRKTPYFYWAYEIYPNQLTDAPKSLECLMKSVERKGCARAEAAIVTSDIWARLLRRRYRLYGLKHCLICVCPPRVTEFSAPRVGEIVRFYYHGGYQKGRGLKNLIRAMRGISRGKLYLRGIGADYEAELKSEVEKLRLGDRVKFLDPLPAEELAESATPFDVGVIMACMTTANARFLIGFKTFENLAAGLSLLAPPSFQLREIINGNRVGVIYDNCGESEIAAALQFCVQNKERIEICKNNARLLAESRYNIKTQGVILKNLLRQTI